MNQANGHGNNSHYDWNALMHDGLAHRSLYTDPAIFELEMVKVFGGSWTFLGHESEIAKLTGGDGVTVVDTGGARRQQRVA